MKILSRFLQTYEYASFEEFMLSLAPSFKYRLQSLTLTLSFLAGIVDQLFGIGPALAVAMVVAILVETWSGIKASKKRGQKFSSFRFSRCIIKIFVWFTLLYITHAFESDFAARSGIVSSAAHLFFQFVFIVILTYFMIEYVTSILENMGSITGKDKRVLIDVIQNAWKRFLCTFKYGKKDENETPTA
jgi:hypothetical protein